MIDRGHPPEPGPLRTTRFPPFERVPLANGLEVVAVRRRRVPLVLLEWLSPGGAVSDPQGKAGLASVTASLLAEGTRRHTGPQISLLVEGLGGGLATGANWSSASVALELQSRHLHQGLELLAEMGGEATFPEAELERLRRRLLGEMVRRRDQPGVQAELRLARELYGEDFVYGGSVRGFEDSLRDLERDDAVDFHRQHWTPASSALTAVGDFDLDTLVARAEACLGALPAPPPSPEPKLLAPAGLVPRTVIVDRPGSSQTELRIGKIGLPRRHPDYHAMRLLTTLLGGKFTSRLNLNLREKHGYTYGIYSVLTRRRGPGPIVVTTAVANDVAGAAVGEILSELRRLVEEPPGQEEVADTAQYLIGIFPFSLQSIHGVARYLEDLITFGLPNDYFENHPERFAAITPEQVLDAARRYLDPEAMTVIAVGPASELRAQLEALGRSPVVVEAI